MTAADRWPIDCSCTCDVAERRSTRTIENSSLAPANLQDASHTFFETGLQIAKKCGAQLTTDFVGSGESLSGYEIELGNGTVFAVVDASEAYTDRRGFPHCLGPFDLEPTRGISPCDLWIEPHSFEERTKTSRGFSLGIAVLQNCPALQALAQALQGKNAHGYLSPLCPVSRSAEIRGIASIPDKACLCAWSYPIDAPCEQGALSVVHDQPWASNASDPDVAFLSLGGFVYFSNKLEVVGIVALVPLGHGSFRLYFGPPQQLSPQWIEKFWAAKRFRRLTLPQFSSLRAEHFRWVRPQFCFIRAHEVLGGRFGSFAYLLGDWAPRVSGGPWWCSSSRAVVPYARRGVSLPQLQAIQAAYVDSGWLEERCRRDARTGQALPQDSYALAEFVVRPTTTPSPPPRDVVPFHLTQSAGAHGVPVEECSYSELANPTGLDVDAFVSHYWGNLFVPTVQALEQHARWMPQQGKGACLVDARYWICLFALNQHHNVHEVGSSPDDAPFNQALKNAPLGAVMVLDAEVLPLQRLWCLFELKRVCVLGKPLELVTEHGVISDIDCSGAMVVELTNIQKELQNISAFRADTSSEEDRMNILFHIANNDHSGLTLHDFSLHVNVTNMINEDAFSDFDLHVTQLLAAPMLRVSRGLRNVASMLRYVGLGASCELEDLVELERLGVDLKANVVRTRFADTSVSLAHVAAFFGHRETLAFLLDCGAPASSVAAHGVTPLHYAARNGNFLDAALLLDHGGCELALTACDGGETPLLWAVIGGHLAVAHLLLDYGGNELSSLANRQGVTPLMAAASSGYLELTALLLDRGGGGLATVTSSDGRTALMHAAQCGHLGVAALLLDYCGVELARVRDKDGWTALMLASRVGHVGIAALLLDRCGDDLVRDTRTNGETSLMWAAVGGYLEVSKLLLDRGGTEVAKTAKSDGHTPLMAAADGGHLDVATLLLDRGGNELARATEDDGWTALTWAVQGGHVEIAALLLERGGDELIAPAPTNGRTPLHHAARGGHLGMSALLLDHGGHELAAAIDHDGWTSLMDAAVGGHVEVAALLLKHGGTNLCEAKDVSGATPLHAAASTGQLKLAAYLVEQGGERIVATTDDCGNTPLHTAALSGQRELVAFLLDHGASPMAENNRGLTAMQVARPAGQRDFAWRLQSPSRSRSALPLKNPSASLSESFASWSRSSVFYSWILRGLAVHLGCWRRCTRKMPAKQQLKEEAHVACCIGTAGDTAEEV